MADEWVACWLFSSTPANAVVAGYDCDGSTIYVGRIPYSDDLLPGKAIPNRYCACVSYRGKEIEKYSYEILVGNHYKWVPAAANCIPNGAVKAGHTSNGQPLYVGRTNYRGTLTCGKVDRCLYIPFGGNEIRFDHGYEILVRTKKLKACKGVAAELVDSLLSMCSDE